jgi:broad specificity phosphatase PhoE
MAEIVLVRHGETEWSKSGQHTGRTDIPLTRNGRKRAAELEPMLRHRAFGLALSSPMERARDTAVLAGVGLRRVGRSHNTRHPSGAGGPELGDLGSSHPAG